MKKLLFISALAFLFASCDKDEEVTPKDENDNADTTTVVTDTTTNSNPSDTSNVSEPSDTTSGNSGVSSSVEINTWKTYDVFRLQSVATIVISDRATLKFDYGALGNGSNGNIDLTFNFNEIKPGTYKITNQMPSNDNEVQFRGSLSARPGSSVKSIWPLEEELLTEKVKIEMLSNGDYLITLAPTKVLQVSGSDPYNAPIETKVQFNYTKNTLNGEPSISVGAKTINVGGKLSSEINGGTGITLTGIDVWAGDIASTTATLETDDENIWRENGVYIYGPMQPKAGSTITYKVENGVFTGTMTDVVLTDGTTEETVSAEFYVIL